MPKSVGVLGGSKLSHITKLSSAEVEAGRGGNVISSGTFIHGMLSKRGTIYRPPAGIKVFRLESGKLDQATSTYSTVFV